jgi:thioredoxin-dependent peroxiredoxin
MASARQPVIVGAMAPDFTLLNHLDEKVSLSQFRGKVVVLFFYPKDDTSGCTVEACSFRDTLPRFDDLDAVVLGISPDSPKSHRKFIRKYALNYTLLADEDHAVAERYGLWVEKSMYGRKYWGVARTTFIIDAKGRIAEVFEKVRPEEHAVRVAAALAALK